jgi:hypothetical protein
MARSRKLPPQTNPHGGQMSELKLREKVQKVFKETQALCAPHASLKPLHDVLRECSERLDQPMRVAIVGFIKAGKSTAMNALLGELLVATGTVEATFNVNWLKWGASSSLMVHYKNERPPESKSFKELEALTLRANENLDYLLSIKFIEVFHPNPMLKTFNLIDTPGLASFYKDDSQNTIDFIKLHGQELTEVTQSEASNADAVLYLFSQSLHMEEKTIVEHFQGAAIGQPTPINAIGVLTKIDFYWPDKPDPLAAGETIATRLREDAQVRRLFYTIYPVSGLLGLGAQTLAPDEFETLRRLAGLPIERFERLIRNVHRFAREHPDIDISPVHRQAVLDKLGRYGVDLSIKLIREGFDARERLAEELFRRSGVPQLLDLVISHFGNRALLIKLGTVLRQIEGACFQERRRLKGQERDITEDVAARFDELETDEHAFHELRILRSHYEGKLEFDASEVQQLLEVTGEYGSSIGERLGLGERATASEIVQAAQEKLEHWQRKANDFSPVNRETIDATNVLARSYERLLYHAKMVKHYMYL